MPYDPHQAKEMCVPLKVDTKIEMEISCTASFAHLKTYHFEAMLSVLPIGLYSLHIVATE